MGNVLSVVNRLFSRCQFIDKYLVIYFFPIGLVIQLTGVLWLGKGSGWVAQTYTWLMLPAFLSLVLNSKSIWSFRLGLGWWCFLVFIMLAFLSKGWSDVNLSWWDTFKQCVYVVLYVYALIRLCERPKILKKVLLLCVILAVIAAFISLIYRYGIQGYPVGYRQYRIYSLITGGFADLGYPIMAGFYYGIFAAILLAWQANNNCLPWSKVCLAWIGIAILGLYVAMTWSRGAWVSLTCAFLFILVMSCNKKSICFCMAIVFVCLSLIFSHLHIFSHSIVDGTYSARTDIWRSTMERISERPWFGYGYGASFSAKNNLGIVVHHPHSYFLQLVRQYGFVGGVLFLVMLANMAYLSIKYRSCMLVSVGSAVLAFGLVGMVTDVKHIITRPGYDWFYIWLPLGLLLGMRRFKLFNH